MYVDSYCERTAPGLWNEPANAVSNLAFLVAAAVLIGLMGADRRGAPRSVWLLPVLLAVVGVCSLSFHTFATTATAALDTLSILAFILTAVVVLVHWMWRVRWRWAWPAAPAYLVAAVGVNAALLFAGGERATVGGYLPALLGLVGFGVAIRYTAPPAAAGAGRRLLLAGAIFAVSLTLRTLDGPLCGGFHLGTHFLWHVLNATVLFLVGLAVLRRWQDLGSGTVVEGVAEADGEDEQPVGGVLDRDDEQ
ncbi:ceramidase domain-containing protein [Dactylosporangium sp. NPDC049525]|uniref:ceramidase domain-containing protein n=1 Tax=Dactylosporangium sp. NPDC049525 TaxID=3154730 RepID=UPI003432451F